MFEIRPFSSSPFVLGHHDPKNLGSTGFLPTLQSYICRWNNTCHNRSRIQNDFIDDSPLWQQLLNLSENLSEILDDEQISADLTKLFSQISRLDRYATLWNGEKLIFLLETNRDESFRNDQNEQNRRKFQFDDSVESFR